MNKFRFCLFRVHVTDENVEDLLKKLKKESLSVERGVFALQPAFNSSIASEFLLQTDLFLVQEWLHAFDFKLQTLDGVSELLAQLFVLQEIRVELLEKLLAVQSAFNSVERDELHLVEERLEGRRFGGVLLGQGNDPEAELGYDGLGSSDFEEVVSDEGQEEAQEVGGALVDVPDDEPQALLSGNSEGPLLEAERAQLVADVGANEVLGLEGLLHGDDDHLVEEAESGGEDLGEADLARALWSSDAEVLEDAGVNALTGQLEFGWEVRSQRQGLLLHFQRVWLLRGQEQLQSQALHLFTLNCTRFFGPPLRPQPLQVPVEAELVKLHLLLEHLERHAFALGEKLDGF